MNCLRSLPAFAGCFLELNDVHWVLRSTNVFFKLSRHFYDKSAFIVASLKQYIEDGSGMLLRPCVSHTFFFVKKLSYRYLILLSSITLKSNLIVSGI